MSIPITQFISPDPRLSLDKHKFVFYIYDSLSVL